VNRPTAVIDKSVLHAICEQPRERLDFYFNNLLERYRLVVPSVLVEEVWVNLAIPGAKSLEAIANMAECLLHLRDSWIAEPLEIAFAEMVKRESIEILPPPREEVMNSFFTLRSDNAALAKWVNDRLELRKIITQERIAQQAAILSPGKFARVADERGFFEKFIRVKFFEMLASNERKRNLLEGVLGPTFRTRHPDCSIEIDAAFDAYSLATCNSFPVTLNCIMTAMFYFYAPLCKIRSPNGKQERKILGRGFSDQRSNLDDEKYVQSALMCARLLTRDLGMRNVMGLLKASGLWNGQSVFLDPKGDLAAQIPKRLD